MSGYPRLCLDLPWTPDAIKGYVGCLEPSAGLHDPLQAVAFAIEVNGDRCLFIGLDTLVVTSELTDHVRSVLRSDGVPDANVVIGASHTHAGPDVFCFWDGEPDRGLVSATAAATIDAAQLALGALEPATVVWGQSHVSDVSINRRDEKRGPIDPAVSVIGARSSASGAVLGMLVNFTSHPITLDYSNLQFSADYVWAMRKTVEAVYEGSTTAFLQGAAGNINPARYPYEQRENIYIPQTKENYPVYWGGFDATERMGTIIGAAAVQAIERSVPLVADRIEAVVAQVELPLKRGDDLDAFLEFMNFLPAYRDRLKRLDTLPTQVQRIRVGDLTAVGLPGEPFVELGLEIKSAIDGPGLVAGYSNDDVRYVLTDDAYDSSQYETVGTPLAVGAAPALVDAAVRLL